MKDFSSYNPIRDNRFFKYASTKRYLRIYVPNFAFKHDNSFEGKEKFVGREIQMRRLFMWLTSASRSGSYLITGYRGMGKSVLVSRVLHNISRSLIQWPEFVFKSAVVFLFLSFFVLFCFKHTELFFLFASIAVLCACTLWVNKQWLSIKKRFRNLYWQIKYRQKPETLSKSMHRSEDYEDKQYWRIPIHINLGQEVLYERDVLGLIAQNVRDKYVKFVNSAQTHPFSALLSRLIVSAGACFLAGELTLPMAKVMKSLCQNDLLREAYESFVVPNRGVLFPILMFVFAIWLNYLVYGIYQWLRKRMPFLSEPHQAIDRLNLLCERINASIHEDNNVKAATGDSSHWASLSFFRGKKKIYPIANIREIEQELQDIINSINLTSKHRRFYNAQFIIVFDELDKISGSEFRTEDSSRQNSEDFKSPEFDTSVEGFTGTMEYEERKKNILHLLSNMKLFITTVRAKCVFISGHELFDASLADLSDREFAISSVFNGVLNVDSFLSPEREQNDVSSMTELYLSNILLPEYFLQEKCMLNLEENDVPKKELPSLRWYYEYLISSMLEEYKEADEGTIKEKEQEIQFAVLFLRFFAVFLAHLCNGSPKKISSTVESYIRTESDTNQLFDWGDIVNIGHKTDKNAHQQCVLWIDPTEQQYINFIHYIASPVMNSITNEVSHYGDKLLVASSFILDQIYKYHSKGFSWRNLEQMPELLNANKNPELRDSMASIMEFQLQTHITNVSSGIHQYKFHKQIAEEITYISMISEEASAIFNFTLNESSTVKRYNMRLFSYYQRLSQQNPNDKRYQKVIGMIHENLGDIYSMDEDYYYAIMEYRNALSCIEEQELTVDNIVAYLKCSMKLGTAFEYRRTYENAYMIYTQVIDQLVRFREIDESDLGLKYLYEWTKDWRVKRPVLVNYEAVRDQRSSANSDDVTIYLKRKRKAEEEKLRERFDEKMNPGILDDDVRPQFSQKLERLVSGLSSNFSPEKNKIIEKLAIYEDVDYLYQVIIAKLFLVEKMELGGISYSSLQIAETEFRYLHNATNMDGKAIISADFFHKMASVLYYKNGYVAPPYPLKSMADALYFFDCNITDFIEDYSLKHSGDKEFNAVSTQQNLENFFKTITFDKIDKIIQLGKGRDEITPSILWSREVKDYLKYVLESYSPIKTIIEGKEQEIKNCAERRCRMLQMGYKLPCNACRYTHRSLDIQLEHFFVNDIVEKHKDELQMVSFLRLTSRKHIQHLRPSETSLLAHTMEQMGDIMLSCALTRTAEFDAQSRKMHVGFSSYDWEAHGVLQDCLSTEVIELLGELSGVTKSEVEREEIINQYVNAPFTKNDRVLLYYWCAARFYEIGSLYKEAAYCVERMLKVIQEYLLVLNNSESADDMMCKSVDALSGFTHFHGSLKECGKGSFRLVNNLFRRVVRYVGRKFNNYGLGEIVENRWLYHMEMMDKVDLMLLSEYSDLKSAFLIAVDIKLNCLCFEKRFNRSLLQKKVYLTWYREYLSNVYERVSNPLIHDKTFKEEILGYYMKAVLNKHVLIDCFGMDLLSETRLTNQMDKRDRTDFYTDYYNVLSEFIEKDGEASRLDHLLFSASDARERLQLVEFLIQDSIVCLSSILSVLTPHNHYTSFSNSFMGDVYSLLWEWAIYYESTYKLYLYRRYDEQFDSVTKMAIAKMTSKGSTVNQTAVEEIMKKCLGSVSDVSDNKTQGGYQYSRLFMNIRHDIDDATIHHIFTNYAAESAVKYYNLAKDINNEGVEYKNLIMGMYVLDDDLRNDTCQSNLADERYMLHCGIIERRRDILLNLYCDSNIALLGNYEKIPPKVEDDTRNLLRDRQKDSIYINSEY